MLLGQILIREGFCTEQYLLQALDAQRAGDKRRIGEILLTTGKIQNNHLKKALSIQHEGYQTFEEN